MARLIYPLILLITVAVAGCASLPDYKVLHRPAAKATPNVIGADGPLSKRQSAAVYNRLQKQGDGSLIEKHIGFMETVSDIPLVIGNAVRVLIDGPATHSAMFKAISQARDHINLETYIFSDDETGQKLASLLKEKRAQGVRVNLLYDGVGSLWTPAEFFQDLRAVGVATCEFNPVNPLQGKALDFNQRDHRKILVVDGVTGYTGGVNIDSVYSSGSASLRGKKPDTEQGWRDTHIEIKGPAVAELQKMFLDTWAEQKCADLSGGKYFPELERVDNKVLRVIASSADEPVNLIYAELLSAISNAEQTIHLTIAYFVPDPQTMEALRAAAARGVDVKIILPGFSDFWVVFHAGRSHYGSLLDAGVKIYERRDAMVHAKTAVIDGVWSTVGSANMDWRSFLHNDELNVVVLGEGFANEMETIFQADMAQATAIDPGRWKNRGITPRVKEFMARLWEYWL